ncbi:MAG: hypothetical protein CML33_09000 [Rhodobacteraceae bacterium]|mgnify:CR=1 FL=1|nr:hypothetical protein [Paracoccaceae bacterium]
MTSTVAIIFFWACAGAVGARTALPDLNLGKRIFLFGCFSLLSTYLAAVSALWLISRGVINPLLILLCCGFLFMVMGFCINKLLERSGDRDGDGHYASVAYFEDVQADRRFQLFITSLFLVFFLSYAYRTLLEPLWGWDTLWYWAIVASNIITEPLDGNWLFTAAPHPSTTPALLAIPVMGENSGAGVHSIYWILTFASLLIMIYGQALAVTASKIYALISAFFFATMPLAENHASSSGYAELFVCGSLFSFSTAFCFRLHNRFWLLLSCILLLSLLITKNTGPLFLLIMAGAAFLQVLVDRGISYYLLMKFFFAWVVLAFLAAGYLQYLGHPIIFGYRMLEFDVFRWPMILVNEFHSKIFNQSFSVLPVLFFITLTAVLSNRVMKQTRFTFHDKPFFLFSIGGALAMLLFSQLTTYGFNGGQPESDTIMSRHSLPLAALLISAMPYVYLIAISGSHRYKDS